jgi:hypothetical protein
MVHVAARAVNPPAPSGGQCRGSGPLGGERGRLRLRSTLWRHRVSWSLRQASITTRASARQSEPVDIEQLVTHPGVKALHEWASCKRPSGDPPPALANLQQSGHQAAVTP